MKNVSIAAALAVLALGAAPAAAGPLGGIGGLPDRVLGGIGQTAGHLGDDLDNTVQGARRDIVGRPAAPNAFDRDGDGARVLRRTVIAIAPSEADLALAQRLDFAIVRRDTLPSLGLTVVLLRAPGGMDARAALAALRAADAGGPFDYDHIYDPSGAATAATDAAPPAPLATRDARIGLVDGGIARRHPALAAVALSTVNLAGRGDGPPTAHGTAIASILVGEDGDFRGCLPGARLYAADVYGGQAGGGGALEIARALDWMAANDVPVVNISLAGPANLLLERAVQRFVARGGVIVAAVGNDGPAAPQAYPAGYADVVGVTSVDARHRLQIDANRGRVTFAALGVDVRAARLERGYGRYTGTSFAAPIVAARFALLMAAPDPRAARRAMAVLRRAAAPLDAAAGLGYLAPPGGAE